jgi:hypothetical protein
MKDGISSTMDVQLNHFKLTHKSLVTDGEPVRLKRKLPLHQQVFAPWMILWAELNVFLSTLWNVSQQVRIITIL